MIYNPNVVKMRTLVLLFDESFNKKDQIIHKYHRVFHHCPVV